MAVVAAVAAEVGLGLSAGACTAVKWVGVEARPGAKEEAEEAAAEEEEEMGDAMEAAVAAEVTGTTSSSATPSRQGATRVPFPAQGIKRELKLKKS